MTREVRIRYLAYLADLQSMSVEEYEALLGRTLSPVERDIFEGRTGQQIRESP